MIIYFILISLMDRLMGELFDFIFYYFVGILLLNHHYQQHHHR